MNYYFGMQNNYSTTRLYEVLLRGVLWNELKKINWMNQRASPKEAYRPTEVEHIANVITHGIWIAPSIWATLELLYRSHNGAQFFSGLVYGAALIFLFCVSTCFHCVFYRHKHGHLKDVLHRCDRAMIYIFIAGSYFPWLTLQSLPSNCWASSMKWLVWLLAALGIVYQQVFHEKYKMLETICYVIMGIFPFPFIVQHDFHDGWLNSVCSRYMAPIRRNGCRCSLLRYT
ncbi:monocyte to macrophage differentiation factor 2 isoform X3 [Photinus pyralis]|uniref:monocyte to macrophage differentiation factor 2 isoform X3 n=1 Tax=Photinus pyralis TaxID=7054 RepID=UPI001266FA21|nr:monocyte to macrophage differentiation factor 2 isoform X3 [Photinus pyralis]